MQAIKCEMCGSSDFVKSGGFFVCQNCGTKYTAEEAKKMMIEGTVSVEGTVKIDNSAYIEKCYTNANRALQKEDWEEVEKYYNLIEQNSPNNMEAVFFSSYGRAMLSLTDSDYYKREQKFSVLKKSMSVLNDYYELTSENKEEILKKIDQYIDKMMAATYVYRYNNGLLENQLVGHKGWCKALLKSVRDAFLTELKQIAEKHNEAYIQELIKKYDNPENQGGCYVATCVYGSYDCPQVWTLRRYRDNKLAKTWHGRAFIRTYYAISPTLVKWFGKTKWFKRMWKGKLDNMVAKLQKEGFEDTPYDDKKW